jgi:hypothetical protein
MLFSPIEEHREDTADFAERLRERILFGGCRAGDIGCRVKSPAWRGTDEISPPGCCTEPRASRTAAQINTGRANPMAPSGRCRSRIAAWGQTARSSRQRGVARSESSQDHAALDLQ